MYRAFCAFVFD